MASISERAAEAATAPSGALSTIGLSLLRKRGRAGAGAALLATAAGISLLARND